MTITLNAERSVELSSAAVRMCAGWDAEALLMAVGNQVAGAHYDKPIRRPGASFTSILRVLSWAGR